MKDNWEELPLGEVCDVRDGTHDSPKYVENGFPFVTSKNLSERGLDLSDISYISEFDHRRFSQRSFVENGDILFGMIGTVGKPIIVKEKFEFSIKNVALLKFAKTKNLLNDFAIQVLKSFVIEEQFRRKSDGGVQSFVSLSTIRNIDFPVPPLPQQQKIAKILSTVDSVIEKTENAIAKYQAIKQGLLHDLFTRGIDLNTGRLRPKQQDAPELYKESVLGWIPLDWKIEELGNIGDFKNGVNKDKESFGSGTPFVNISDAYPEVLNTSKLSRVKVSNLEKSIYKLEKGDIIFVRSSVKPSGVGYTTLYNEETHTIIYCGFMIRFRLDDKINHNPFFYNNYFRYEYFRRRLLCVSTVSANTNVNQESLKKLNCIKPLKEEQVKANKKLISITTKIQTEQETLAKYQQVKAGLLQDLLTGTVAVNVE